mmetsp:Transcript_18076/g.46212  ORF Transcript_18076/g.46212 Transcript_18076/m.46212 type:complete len:248 (-) Transcript_18076:72-815(-)|eukprot:CAMPEP_0115875704 /NCGR_PEP_ID=MMETSP0287-20121206/25246_1 /TAXON_ID=412157 /ORGANISM="Chrysochromulina rotalis, Strain UIO044" /LENGTH=247 /DNA_ID=CAMNT_0003330999 /DNA_START=39 /DNA_END=782 /DNA_ORIENTATION=-
MLCQFMPSNMAPSILARARVPPPVVIRSAIPEDIRSLANLCADALYGEASLLSDGPIVCAQHLNVVQGMKANFARRIAFESDPEYGIGDDQEVKFFIAEDASSGEICGCLDMAIHLFDKQAGAFELDIDEMPEDPALQYRWSPYIASLSVSRPTRGRGVGRQLVLEAERWAKRKGYGEIMLEVSQTNLDAIGFYERGGYKVVSSFAAGEAGGGGEDVTRKLFWWEIRPAAKLLMRKQLELIFREKRD